MESNNAAAYELLARLLLGLIALNWFAAFVSGESRLSKVEMTALRQVAKKLGKKDWDFSVDPCSEDGNWNRLDAGKGFESYVTCDCSFNNSTACHIVNLVLKGENLTGFLPPELARLRHLQQLDLSRNLLRGTVPPQWATTRLVGLYLMANNLSGPFPMALTKITSLQNLTIEGNRFKGAVPKEIGNLIGLQKLVLSANEFTGRLPESMANLSNLTDLRISSNNFSGKIPNFIGKWRQLSKLLMEGCSFGGPISSGISELKKMKDLRISDIYGRGDFPDLSRMKSLKTLVLRNCSIHGSLPEYIGNMKKVKTLDLSFNDLVGDIPSTYSSLEKSDFIYLTGNKLTGSVPEWILKSNKNVDISQNNFTWGNSSPTECPQGSVNLVESYESTPRKVIGTHSCLERAFPCAAPNKERRYSLHINCGGKELLINGTKYEADMEVRGASMFYSTQTWAFSSTGNFMDNDMDADNYIARNSSKLSMPNSALYTTARLSPLSLSYYGLCLMNGNYTVKLHFAEIIFSNDNTFGSLGRRIFNVFIQGKLVLKDFNIEDEAMGTGKAIVKNFNTVVTSNTLVIRFNWAGKGTTSIPIRGVYGPLISAISVDPNFVPPSADDKKKYVKILVEVLASVTFLILSVLAFLWWKGCLGNNASMEKVLQGLDLQTGLFTLKQIKDATKNFDPVNKIGEGGFGSVYKGMLSDGTVIAVKQLSSKSKQGNREFVNEIGMISALKHPNLVKLYGCCIESHQLLLIYEYMENNCLSKALFGKEVEKRINLDWPTRLKICLGIAKGLAYLHEESTLKIVHRDIKTSNVLLDKNLNAKISDFGLAKLVEEDKTHISTRVAGTIGYMAPEYAMRGYLTDKADVYSFGVVVMETISGKSNTNYRPEEFVYLLDWAYVLQERGNLLALVDPNLGSEFNTEEALVMLNVALLCTNASPTLRPKMSMVVSMLEGRTAVQPPLSEMENSSTRSRLKSNRSNFWQCPSPVSTDVPSTESFVSTSDREESEANLRLISVRSV